MDAHTGGSITIRLSSTLYLSGSLTADGGAAPAGWLVSASVCVSGCLIGNLFFSSFLLSFTTPPYLCVCFLIVLLQTCGGAGGGSIFISSPFVYGPDSPAVGTVSGALSFLPSFSSSLLCF